VHRLTEFSLRRPWLSLGVLLVVTGFLAVGLPQVKQGYGSQVLVGGDHPAVRALDSLVDEFAGGYPVRIAWECGAGQPCATVFDAASLTMADALARELYGADGVVNVLGPANASVLVASEAGFAARRFVEQGVVASDSQELAQRALEDPLWVGDLVSADARVGVIVVQPADNAPETDQKVVDTIEAALAPFRAQGFSYHVVGDAPESIGVGRTLSESTSALIPVLVLVIAALLFLMTRSWQQTLATLATMGVALLWTRGALGWFGWPQDAILQVLAPVVVIVGVCDAVHLLSRFAAERLAAPASRPRALVAAARDAGPACVITTLTTAVAFASFTVSDLDTFLRFGVIMPLGVFACLVLSFSLLPLAIGWLPDEAPRSERVGATWGRAMDALLAVSSRGAAPLLAAGLLLFGFFGFGWAVHLRADHNLEEMVGSSSEVVQAVSFVEDALGTVQSLEIDVRLPPGTAIEDPATLQVLAGFSAGLSPIPMLGEAESVLDLLERMNRLLHGDAPEFERFGASPGANAELLELLAFDDPDTLGRWLSMDRTRLRISVGGPQTTQHARDAVLAAVHRHVREFLPESWEVQLTGEIAFIQRWVHDLAATQFRSFPIAFAIVFVLIAVFLRSWRLGLAAMLPTVLPVVVVLGAMGWLDVNLDLASAMIAAVVIGIGVDDSIHLLRQYQRRREAGEDSHEAMRGALRHTGRAVVTTSIALALGFYTLQLSAWQAVANFGFLISLAVLGALAATLLVLPALIFAFAPQPSRHARTGEPSRSPLSPPLPEAVRDR